MMHLLLTQGANIEAKNNIGFTALLVAANYGQNEALTTLINKGADINPIETLHKKPVLTLAENNDHLEIMTRLTKHNKHLEEIADFLNSRTKRDEQGYILEVNTNSLTG